MTEPRHGTSSEDAVESGALDDERPDSEGASADDAAEGERDSSTAPDDQ